MNTDKFVENIFEEEVNFLSKLVSKKSTRGNEAKAQQQMLEILQQDSYQVDKVPLDIAKLEKLPGFSPVTIDYSDMEDLVGHYGNKNGKGRSLIINGHIDVVPEGPLEGWSVPPYEGLIKDGKLYGRGAADMKAGLVGTLFALRALNKAGYQPDAPVYFQSVVEEESTGNGALACLEAGYSADAVLIGEPFNFITDQLGVMWFQINLWGKPVHVEDATSGLNAIEAMIPIIATYRELEVEWNNEKKNYPGFAEIDHPINLNVGEFHGGDWTSSVPSWSSLNLRIAVYPGDDMTTRQKQIEEKLAQLIAKDPAVAAVQPKIVYHGFLADGYTLPKDTEAEKLFTDVHKQVLNRDIIKESLTCTTDSRFFGLYKNIPSLVFGPKGSHFHAFDEYVELDSLLEVTKVYTQFIAQWCGLSQL